MLEQNDAHPIYLFSLTGEEVLKIADIARVERDEQGKLAGYQRPEIKRHVEEILRYLESGQIIFPNSLILALSSTARFKRAAGRKLNGDIAVNGTIEIDLPRGAQPKPAWIVDGQQRAMAIARSSVRGSMPLPINAFIADDVHVQRDQFLRVNSAKPLPRGLITELLPQIEGPLPAKLAAKRIPSAVCDLLNSSKNSPFHKLIRRPSTPPGEKRQAVITDSSMIKVIEDSLSTPSGCLFPYRNIATGETDFDAIWRILTLYWSAVKAVFPDAWGLPPSKSRLMHGAGMRAMGRLMDRVIPAVQLENPNAQKDIERELKRVKNLCQWTAGRWEELGGLRWNEIQNVPSHIKALSNVLIRAYIQA